MAKSRFIATILLLGSSCAYLTTADAPNVLLVFPGSVAPKQITTWYSRRRQSNPSARQRDWGQRVYLRFGPSTSRYEDYRLVAAVIKIPGYAVDRWD
jgi:hypothetical protein